MSRLKNFARGVFSGYVQMAANIAFTLASVPLALHYLSKEEFALWALVTQVTSYFALIDVGMGVSVARVLADHKDARDGGRYGGVLKAGAVVFTAQGALIALATLLCAAPLATAFEIGPRFGPILSFSSAATDYSWPSVSPPRFLPRRSGDFSATTSPIFARRWVLACNWRCSGWGFLSVGV